MKLAFLGTILTVIGLTTTVFFGIIAIKKKEKLPVIFSIFSAGITLSGALISQFSISDVEIFPNSSSIPIETIINFEYPSYYDIYYTLDGSNPEEYGLKYEKPFVIDTGKIIDEKLTICYTAKMGLFWLDNDKQEYKVIFAHPSEDKEDETVIINDETYDFSTSNADNNRLDDIIVSADKKVFIPDGLEIVLRTASGYFLSLNEDGNYYANKSEIDNSCLMKIKLTNDGYTGFYNIQSGTYATAAIDKDPVVLCSVNTYMQSWECFSLFQDNEFVTISSQGKERNNDDYKYVTSDEDDINRAIYVRAKDAKAWEDFSIFIYYPDDGIWRNPFASESISDNGCH